MFQKFQYPFDYNERGDVQLHADGFKSALAPILGKLQLSKGTYGLKLRIGYVCLMKSNYLQSKQWSNFQKSSKS